MKPVSTLAKAFSRLTDTQLQNLVWHADHKTPICCGDDTYLYTDGKGGG
jgi:hypothetical protein